MSVNVVGGMLKVRFSVKVPLTEIGGLLICDDPECHPLVTYGQYTRAEIAKRLGWAPEIEKMLRKRAEAASAREAVEHRLSCQLVRNAHWHAYERLVQDWAMRKLKLEPKDVCFRCKLFLEPGGSEIVVWDDHEFGAVMHQTCYDEWREQQRQAAAHLRLEKCEHVTWETGVPTCSLGQECLGCDKFVKFWEGK